MDKNASYGIGHNSDADTLYDIYQVIRHQIWKDDKRVDKPKYTNQAYPATKFSKQPLIEIKQVFKKGEAPEDYFAFHHKNCGTKFRGCDPENCPKEHYEKTGYWKPELLKK